MLQELRESVANETMAFAFACGDNLPIVSRLPDAAEETAGEKLRATSCLPIDLRWNSNDKAMLSSQTKVTFPLELTTEKI